jgi:hypothetical protein
LVKHLKCSDAFVYAYNVSSASVASAKHHWTSWSFEETTLSIPNPNPPKLRFCVHIVVSSNLAPNFRTQIHSSDANVPDATAASCFKRLNLYFPDRVHNLMKKRVRFIKYGPSFQIICVVRRLTRA